MSIDPALYETDDSTLAAEIAFGVLESGETSPTSTKHLWNGNGNPGADTVSGLMLTVYERQVVRDPDTNEVTEVTAWNQEGRATIERWVQVRYTDPDGNLTPWTPVGKGRWLGLEDLAAGEYHPVEIRMVVPGGAITSAEREFRIVPAWDSFSNPTDLGHHETGAHGVLSGIGDGAESHLVTGYEATATATPDNNVNFAEGVALIDGLLYVDLAHAVALDGNDGDAAALASGEEYWVTFSKGDQSGLTATKSSKGAAPLANSARPAIPVGEVLVAYVRRPFDATIENGDIDQDPSADGFVYGRFNLETSGLSFTLHPGRAALDNRIVTRDGLMTGTLTASETNIIRLDPLTGGTFTNPESDPSPVDRALPLWKVVTDGSGETSREDLRSYAGPREEIFRADKIGALGASEVLGYHVLSGGRDAVLPVPMAVRMALGSQASGATTGAVVGDLEYSDSGGAWTSVFTSSPTPDRRPTIDFDASDPVDLDALPEVTEIPAGARLRWSVEYTGDGTPPSDVVAIAILVRP